MGAGAGAARLTFRWRIPSEERYECFLRPRRSGWEVRGDFSAPLFWAEPGRFDLKSAEDYRSPMFGNLKSNAVSFVTSLAVVGGCAGAGRQGDSPDLAHGNGSPDLSVVPGLASAGDL